MTRAIVLFIGLGLVGLFALINWPAFAALTEINLLVTTVQAPLGLIMLGALAFLAVLFVSWALSLQATALMDSRRLGKDLQTQRELADKAEASRFVELRSFMSAELLRVSQASYEARADLLARMDRLQDESRGTLQDTANTLSAYIGELEDRMERSRDLEPGERRRTDIPETIR
jgi:hypothetical protein